MSTRYVIERAPKTPGAAGGVVKHDLRLVDGPELLEVLLQQICGTALRIPVRLAMAVGPSAFGLMLAESNSVTQSIAPVFPFVYKYIGR